MGSAIFKGTVVFIKWLLFACANAYIVYKLVLSEEPLETGMIIRAFSFPDSGLYFFLFMLLLPMNWALESWKWKYLVAEGGRDITFFQSSKAVLSGLATGVFTPNRVGEFAGRIWFMDAEFRPAGIMLTLFNSLTQMLVTVAAMATSLILYQIYFKGEISGIDEIMNPLSGLLMYGTLFIVFALAFLKFLPVFGRSKVLQAKVARFLLSISRLKQKTLFVAAGISGLRYIVFLVQYWLIIQWFGIVDQDWTGWIMIPVIFFMTSFLPGAMFLPLDISVRSAAAVYFLGPLCFDHEAIIFASVLIWSLNVAFPAIVGSILLLQSKENG